jgi:hypothetical protein
MAKNSIENMLAIRELGLAQTLLMEWQYAKTAEAWDKISFEMHAAARACIALGEDEAAQYYGLLSDIAFDYKWAKIEEPVAVHCPKCGSDDITEVHREGDLLAPECDYLFCMACEHQWGHQ